MIQNDEQLQYPWDCVACNQQNDYFLKKCQYCGTVKEQFCQQMKFDYQQNDNQGFTEINIIDFECNKVEDRREILELLICKLKLSESNYNVVFSKQLIIKPYLIPLIQNPEYSTITQEQADQGISFQESFQFLSGDIYIFENREKAKIYLEQCQYCNLQCPIKKYIELRRVYPNSNGQLTLNAMMKELKIPYQSDCFALAEVVSELLDRAYKFELNMLQTLKFPIPEEEARLQGFDNIIILDFEATCIREADKKYLQEIIEFPAQVYNIQERKVIKEFSKYIKPIENPILSEFCTELTGITQQQVDEGIPLDQAINEFMQFIQGLQKCCILTCGDYDLNLLKKEGARKGIPIQKELQYYINIKKVFPKSLRNPKHYKDPCMVEMLKLCGLDLLGRHHSGIDDVKNITRIVHYLINEKNFQFDERMVSYTFKI
ncbi:unnamed protein product [Paramecium primaurelia]|uniref:RanBP2-type domain-containing protein n=1 Tax=Paramecium primaurelia TaxID=5886 RepID=A0A8S1KWF7_PARPR|nr:unnamed protein product [Paramecium primaurelia]